MADDGTGLAALERLREGWVFPEGVELVDGGTWGMNLLPLIEATTRLVLVDSIRAGRPAGTLTVLERADLPRYLGHKLSPHQIDLREVLALAELRGSLPAEAVAIGLEPARVELSTDLSEPVAAALDDLVARVVERLKAWGYRCLPAAAEARA
jgi:hydrogenase maturation protease